MAVAPISPCGCLGSLRLRRRHHRRHHRRLRRRACLRAFVRSLARAVSTGCFAPSDYPRSSVSARRTRAATRNSTESSSLDLRQERPTEHALSGNDFPDSAKFEEIRRTASADGRRGGSPTVGRRRRGRTAGGRYPREAAGRNRSTIVSNPPRRRYDDRARVFRSGAALATSVVKHRS